MRAGLDLPVVDADAAQRPRRRCVLEGDDGVVAHRTREDVAEHHGRPAGAGEGQAQPAAFAGVVERHAGLAEAGARRPPRRRRVRHLDRRGRRRAPWRCCACRATSRPHAPAGSTPAVSKRWLVVSAVIGCGRVKLAPSSLERAKKARPLKFLSWKIAKVTISPPLGSTAMRARASGPQSRLIGSGVTTTGAEKVLPRSDERDTTMRSTIARTSHSVPSGPKAGEAVKGFRRAASGLAVLMLGGRAGGEQERRDEGRERGASKPHSHADAGGERRAHGGDGSGAHRRSLKGGESIALGQVLVVGEILDAAVDVDILGRRPGQAEVDQRGALVELGVSGVVPVGREGFQRRREGELRQRPPFGAAPSASWPAPGPAARRCDPASESASW